MKCIKHLIDANYLIDDAYVRICDLGSPENILSADLYPHHTCYTNYIRKYAGITEYSNESITKRKVFTEFIPLA